MKITILGCGIIGVVNAYFLAKQGHDVTVIEQERDVCLKTSNANGCQLSFNHCHPWFDANVAINICKAFFGRDSYLTINNLFKDDFFAWFIKLLPNFFKNEQIAQNLLKLAYQSRKNLAQILADEDIDFNYKNNGILHFFRSEKKFQKAIKFSQVNKRFNSNFEVLDSKQILQIEPNLREDKFCGGILFKDDASGDVLKFARALARICRDKYQVKFEFNTKIDKIIAQNDKIERVVTNKGDFAADEFVYCLGAYGNKLLKQIGIKLPIYPLKGYSLSFEGKNLPQMAMSDVENKIVYSNIGNVFRAAGSGEIGGAQDQFCDKNINFLQQKFQDSFICTNEVNLVKKWHGFRPMCANILPIIERSDKYNNLIFNCGHGSLGWSLAFAPYIGK